MRVPEVARGVCGQLRDLYAQARLSGCFPIGASRKGPLSCTPPWVALLTTLVLVSPVALGQSSSASSNAKGPETEAATGVTHIPSPNPWVDRPLSLQAHLGLGTPVGTTGVSLEYLAAPAISVGAGLGYGSGTPGLHTALSAMLRPARGANDAFVIGLALSTGSYERRGLFQSGNRNDTFTEYRSNWAHFLQLEFGYESRGDQGSLFRVTAGVDTVLNPGNLACREVYDRQSFGEGYPCAAPASETIPTLGIALGYAF
jgi:hypothetical protein